MRRIGRRSSLYADLEAFNEFLVFVLGHHDTACITYYDIVLRPEMSDPGL